MMDFSALPSFFQFSITYIAVNKLACTVCVLNNNGFFQANEKMGQVPLADGSWREKHMLFMKWKLLEAKVG